MADGSAVPDTYLAAFAHLLVKVLESVRAGGLRRQGCAECAFVDSRPCPDITRGITQGQCPQRPPSTAPRLPKRHTLPPYMI